MEKEAVTIWSLEMTSQDELIHKPVTDPDLVIQECQVKQFQFNRFLYSYIGQPWQWTDKLVWSEDQWRDYAENNNLRLWVGYYRGSPAGYFELQKVNGDIEIVYFGLAQPFIGKGLGGTLLSTAIQEAWNWGAKRVWVHTCSLDHPFALKNYQARGLRVYQEETK
ncbi:GNAT family N-acetyltransferase [Endozoicomonas sp. SCSIO W0465]|uniref:GNAT family N-acetyltransferase n=1 Tax=Endozoicomonas sp. SCSIO W0465 TaxID=2918516 RepID=UPI002074F71F|nr:GNAT family N-acetyltransferase [Endozoicomonas sp. SCSIO W0465]USE37099.1 GNAT family N-acetyltransferase [Endozoicomonas sp. SCSIO W0465]